jgi:hypothetical protein
MNEQLTIPIIGTIGLVLGALISKLRGQENERDTISKDIAIYEMLPKESTVRDDLRKRIDQTVAETLIHDRSLRRDIPGVVTLLLELALGVGVGLFAVELAYAYGWNFAASWPTLWLGYSAIVVAAIYYSLVIVTKLQKRLRDGNGKPVFDNERGTHFPHF